MKLTSTYQLSLSDLKHTEFDLFIGASGYERRSIHVLNHMAPLTMPSRVAFGFEDRLTQQREDNDRAFTRAEVPIVICSGDTGEAMGQWIEEKVSKVGKDKIRILVDYSSMTRTWYAAIIEAVLRLSSPRVVDCVFSYSLAQYSEPHRAVPNASVGPIPRFCSIAAPDKPTALIIGLGYEDQRALGLVEYVDPGLTCVFYTDPAFDPQFKDAVLRNNAALLNAMPKEHKYAHPMLDVQRTGDMLNSVCAGLLDDYRVILAPLGVKPFSLLCMLLATRLSEVDVWRVTPGTRAAPVDRRAAGPIIVLGTSFEAN